MQDFRNSLGAKYGGILRFHVMNELTPPACDISPYKSNTSEGRRSWPAHLASPQLPVTKIIAFLV